MKLRGMIGFLFLMAAGYVIFDITGASPANYIIIKDFAATADVHLIPFMDIWDILRTGDIYNILRNIGGNIALFMPIGFILPLAWDVFRKLSHYNEDTVLRKRYFMENAEVFCARREK